MQRTPRIDVSKIKSPENHEVHEQILKYVQNHDWETKELELSVRAHNCLTKAGFCWLSSFILLSDEKLLAIPGMGRKSVDDINRGIQWYLDRNAEGILAILSRAEARRAEKNARDVIVGIFNHREPPVRLTRDMVADAVNMADAGCIDRYLDMLVTEGKLVYEHPYYSYVYGSFIDSFRECPGLDDREKGMVEKRLAGMTLQEIGDEYGVTRERARQIIFKAFCRISRYHVSKTGTCWFDEDRYGYLYSTYALAGHCDMIPGIPEYICSYMSMRGRKKGKLPVEEAYRDPEVNAILHGDALEQKINEETICIGGTRVRKCIKDIELLTLSLLCRDGITLKDYMHEYNILLEKSGVPRDTGFYYIEGNRFAIKALKMRVCRMENVIHNYNSSMRYYDFDAHDFTAFLDRLDLASYRNTELSTALLMKKYPEMMREYDIRDEYELHSILRKIVPEGSYNNFRCGRMPVIKFGKFNRHDAYLTLLKEKAPISKRNLVEIIHEKYGHDRATCWTYLQEFSQYFHNGIFALSWEMLPKDRFAALKAALGEGYYRISEVMDIYRGLFPDDAVTELPVYDLKKMGFRIYAHCIYKGAGRRSGYFRRILLQDEIDTGEYRKCFAGDQTAYLCLVEAEKKLEIVEVSQDRAASFRTMEEKGLTKEIVAGFRSTVSEAAEGAGYFNAVSLRKEGLTSDIFSLGLTDWTCNELIRTGGQYHAVQAFGTMIFNKNSDFNVGTLAVDIVKMHGGMYIADLVRELKDRYGCQMKTWYTLAHLLRKNGACYDTATGWTTAE